MSGFSKDWLALREPADAGARDVSLVAGLPKGEPLRIVDLGAGTGSNLRYLAPRLDCAQQWTLVDSDAELLSEVKRPQTGGTVSIELLELDLAQQSDALPLGDCDLVTASAFFDLASEAWVESFASLCARAQVPSGLFVLDVDGHTKWTPREPHDDRVASLFHRHMQGDKGFGAALGPRAASVLAESFGTRGYRVKTADSAWRLTVAQADLQARMVDFYANAACEIAAESATEIREWATRRRAHIAGGASELFVGHVDVLVRRA